MTVLIKGMEMPENCAKCPICAFMPLGGYVVYHKCVLLNRLASKHNRRYDCPLVEVPTPHGRLIEADELEQKCMEEPTFIAELLFRKLQNAPTIIEAEE